MKTKSKKIFLILTLFSIVSGLAFADVAEVISIKGKVEVNRNNQWIPLVLGDKVSQTEMISTGFQSEAKIKLNDSVMTLGALTRITLTALLSNEKKEVVDVYLDAGAVRSKVNHSENKRISYTVRSPVAVASVRGTEFTIDANGKVTCYEGAVVVAPAKYYENHKSSKNIEDIESPEEGESSAITDATDIDPYAPAGAVVVSKGQTAVVTSSGFIVKPATTAAKSAVSGKNIVKTQAQEEVVTTTPGNPETPQESTSSVTADLNVVGGINAGLDETGNITAGLDATGHITAGTNASGNVSAGMDVTGGVDVKFPTTGGVDVDITTTGNLQINVELQD